MFQKNIYFTFFLILFDSWDKFITNLGTCIKHCTGARLPDVVFFNIQKENNSAAYYQK